MTVGMFRLWGVWWHKEANKWQIGVAFVGSTWVGLLSGYCKHMGTTPTHSCRVAHDLAITSVVLELNPEP